jgi:ribosomal 30S subunit maturation factor RimM
VGTGAIVPKKKGTSQRLVPFLQTYTARVTLPERRHLVHT